MPWKLPDLIDIPSQQTLQTAYNELELRVRERTAELEEANRALEAEKADREAAEKEVLRLNRLYAVSFAFDNLDHEVRHSKAELELHEEVIERMETADNLREKEQMLIQQNRQASMGEMIENIAHQWRQPLNNLGLIIQQLPYSHEDGELSKDYIDDIVADSMSLIQHMSSTIDVFRNFFRLDKEKVEFMALDEITKTLSLIEGGLKAHWIKVEVEPTDYPVIHGYPNEYSQVLLNIINNAKDAFVLRKTKGPKVSINLFSEDGKAVVTITDNAGGIPDDILHKIFDPYFTTKSPDKGTGVGLFMSKTIIEKNMGGTLTVRNSGDGAEFRIEL